MVLAVVDYLNARLDARYAEGRDAVGNPLAEANLAASRRAACWGCLGQFLAKLEIEAFFNALLDKVETIEPNGPALYTAAPFVSGIKSLAVKYRLKEDG